jgi:hypothetical protein
MYVTMQRQRRRGTEQQPQLPYLNLGVELSRHHGDVNSVTPAEYIEMIIMLQGHKLQAVDTEKE